MKIFLSILVLFAGLTVLSKNSNAQCDCNHKKYFVAGAHRNRSNYKTAFDELQNSPLVFVGKVKSIKYVKGIDNGESYLTHQITFEVSNVWKKNVRKRVTIKQSPSCRIAFEENKEYLVYLSDLDDLPLVDFCSRTKKLSEADSDLAEFTEKAWSFARNVLPE